MAISSCMEPQSQTFKIICLIQLSAFKISKKLNEKSSILKNLRWFRGFALHYQSAQSGESWENFILLAGKGLDYLLIELKLISNQ